MTNPLRKHQLHENVREEIKSFAWEQLAQGGISSLSLSAIARAMGVSTPALYRYFPGYDELVAALMRDAYSSFTAALAAARDEHPADDHAGRFRGLCLTYHRWALAHPPHYNLIFGPAAQGYLLDPATSQVADQSFLLLLEIIQAADQAGKIKPLPPAAALPQGLFERLEAVQHRGQPYSAQVTCLALRSWSFIHGITTLDLYQRYAILLGGEVEAFIEFEVERFMQSIGLS